jgi:hypothetical protein
MSNLEEALAEQLVAHGAPPFTREHRFHPKRKWQLDFAWPEIRVACEVEGGVWTGGRHTRGAGFTADCEKYNEAAVLNWLILRVTGQMVNDGRALHYIQLAIDLRTA